MRWLLAALMASVLALAGCGGGGGATGGGGPGDDDGNDASVVDSTAPSFNTGGDTGTSGPTCTPRTCQQAGANCGPVADGCGGILQCGDCTAPATCGGGGTPSVCGGDAACVPKTCQDLGANCGPQGDGCGNVIQCGNCSAPQTCGGGGAASVCGGTAGCVPLTTCPAGQNCGVVADGCGGVVDCSKGVACPVGEICGGGGTPNQCGAKNVLPDGGIVDGGLNQCTPMTKSQACGSKNCGLESDGCGGTVDCGSCTLPQTCGGGGTPSVCGGVAGCVPQTKCPANMNCGVIADGCGGTVDCSGGKQCPSGTACGGGGTPNVCGGKNVLPDGGIIDGGLNQCTPLTKTQACGSMSCGPASDGCGGTVSCGSCTAPQTCGGGGTPSVCGGTAGCVKKTSCDPGMNCGVQADGCGGTVDCSGGKPCAAGLTCGGGGQPNVCGAKNFVDGGFVDGGLNQCTPIAQATACQGMTCGTTGDGCGGTYNCGTCTNPLDSCGGGGVPFQCGHPSCTPTTSCPANVHCGTYANGCGGSISCGSCTLPQTCGGGGTAYTCGTPACTPLTTCPAGVNCGPQPDGCGGIIGGANGTCGNCTSPAICGGSGVASQCGDGTDGGPTCSGLQCDIPSCDSGTTSISGKVYDPAGKNPLYNVVVYIPNGTVTALTHGASCDSCASLYSGDPLVATTTGTDGSFTLTGVPVPSSGSVPFVIQIGKWRRQMTITGLKKCQDNPQTDKSLRLPGKEAAALADGGAPAGGTIDDLPVIGVSTGGADSMECLFQRIGFDSSEYNNGGTTKGHIRIFQGTDSTHVAAAYNGSTPAAYNKLFDKKSDLTPYDIVILSCDGHETYSDSSGDALTSTMLNAVHDYATAGGRVFASHFHYAFFDVDPYGSENLATWHTGSNAMTTGVNKSNYVGANVVTTLGDGGTFVRGQAMYTWLGNVNALGTGSAPAGELYITDPRHNADVGSSNQPPSQPWLVADNSASSPGATEYFSFDTPTDAGLDDAGNRAYCGRVVYSDLHVGAASGDYATVNSGDTPAVPGDCATGDLSAQEKALEFMIMDLSSCVGSDSNLPIPNPTCTKLTACPSNIVCGTWPDGCGGQIACGSCEAGQCINGACSTSCTKLSCADQHITCGAAGDGCGGTITNGCGTCSAGQACVNGTCVTDTCVGKTCGDLGLHCGPANDGCGNALDCGTCTVAGQTCGGGGQPGVCGQSDANLCQPLSCGAQNIHCGPAGDGCGGLQDCGTCPQGSTCGGGGVPGVCGAPSCVKVGCGTIKCGPAGDGCGGTQNCGTCSPPQTCGGGGQPGVCGQADGNVCQPLSCGAQNIHCGPAGDGCGGLQDCGPCPAGQSCGGGGVPGVCGAPTCTPLGCGSLQCGQTGDGCGGVIDCGTCTPPQTCGGGGQPGVCGQSDANACVPITCQQQGLACGQTGDGCGNLIDCGSCPSGQTCGGGGVPGVCGAPNCTPKTCADLGATCGQVADGCGGLTADCGQCVNGQSCGGGGTPNQCGSPNCTPRTCQQAGANCGPIADGCGGVVQCGDCSPPQTCGGGGTPSVCGGGIK